VCPVKIDIPSILVHERANAVAAERQGFEGVVLRRLGRIFLDRRRYERAQRLGRVLQRPAVRGERVRWFVGPLKGWGASRTLPALPEQTFREWWEQRERGA
jgi:L-lactate dehydrogenase complex protein LldF